eukprot:snap_masked-scaffold_25-processed-gene-1.29-mRNA-1 protein AED:1.00 eAED:1.00 QI:0/-1/0/0/-1/1/1/0/93
MLKRLFGRNFIDSGALLWDIVASWIKNKEKILAIKGKALSHQDNFVFVESLESDAIIDIKEKVDNLLVYYGVLRVELNYSQRIHNVRADRKNK